MNTSSSSKIHPDEVTILPLPIITGDFPELPSIQDRVVDALAGLRNYGIIADTNLTVNEEVRTAGLRMHTAAMKMSPTDAIRFLREAIESSVFKSYLEKFKRHWSFI